MTPTNPEQNQPQGVSASLRDARHRLDEMKPRVQKRLAREDEVAYLIGQVQENLLHILPPDSDAFRVYDRRRRQASFWRTESLDGYASAVDGQELDYWVATIDQVLETLSETNATSALDAKDEHVLRVGETFKAKSLVWEVMKGATLHLGIADQYLDEALLPSLESVDQGVSVHLEKRGHDTKFRPPTPIGISDCRLSIAD